MDRKAAASKHHEPGRVDEVRAQSGIDALSSILRRVRDGLWSLSGDRTREPHDLRKRLSLEKRSVAAETAKPQASRHALAPAAPNYVEPGTRGALRPTVTLGLAN